MFGDGYRLYECGREGFLEGLLYLPKCELITQEDELIVGDLKRSHHRRTIPINLFLHVGLLRRFLLSDLALLHELYRQSIDLDRVEGDVTVT